MHFKKKLFQFRNKDFGLDLRTSDFFWGLDMTQGRVTNQTTHYCSDSLIMVSSNILDYPELDLGLELLGAWGLEHKLVHFVSYFLRLYVIESWLPGIDISVIGLVSRIIDDRFFIQSLLSCFRFDEADTSPSGLLSLLFVDIMSLSYHIITLYHR